MPRNYDLLLAAILSVALIGVAGCDDDPATPEVNYDTWSVPNQIATIAAAADTAAAGDHIVIAPGTYNEVDIVLKSGLKMYAADPESDDDVILDGEGQGWIVLCESGDGRTLLRDVVFTHGAGVESSGGAVLADETDVEVINCVLREITVQLSNPDKSTGMAAFSARGDQVWLTNCVFTGISASGYLSTQVGGAVAVTGGGGKVEVTNTVFADCSCTNAGGAIFVERAVDLTNCTFTSNRALTAGAVSIDTEGHARITNCVFNGNEADFHGGALSVQASSAEILNCTFADGSAEFGGAIVGLGTLELDNVVVSGNTASDHGGGLYLTAGAEVDMTNCQVDANESGGSGGGFYLDPHARLTATGSGFTQNAAPMGPAGYLAPSSIARLICCTIDTNHVEGEGMLIVEDHDCD